MKGKLETLLKYRDVQYFDQLDSELKDALEDVVKTIEEQWENPSAFSLFNTPGRLNVLALLRDALSPPLRRSSIYDAVAALDAESIIFLRSFVPKEVLERIDPDWQFTGNIDIDDEILSTMGTDGPTVLYMRHFSTIFCEVFGRQFDHHHENIFHEERKNESFVGECRYCHRIFSVIDNRRHLCSHHSPKLNRKEYDRARKRIRCLDMGERYSRLSKACRISAADNDPNPIIDAILLFPECNTLLFDWSGVSDYLSLVQFIAGRLDAIDADSAEDADALLSYLANPIALERLIESQSAWQQASQISRKKPGRERVLDPNLARLIRGSGRRKKSYQRVAEILAEEHNIFISRQGVFNALRDQS